MPGLSEADQDRFSLRRFDPGGAAGARAGAVHGPGAAVRDAGRAGVAVVLLQGTDERARSVSRARHLHPADEAEEHAALDARRGSDHTSGPGVLRLRVLVIGGTMFIGRSLAAELLRAGHEVTVLHRKPKHELGKRVQNLVADRNDPESIRQALQFSIFQVVFDNAYDW